MKNHTNVSFKTVNKFGRVPPGVRVLSFSLYNCMKNGGGGGRGMKVIYNSEIGGQKSIVNDHGEYVIFGQFSLISGS